MAIAEIKWKLVKDTYFFDTTTCYLSENGNHLFYTGKEKRIEILIDDLNELVRKGYAMWLKLGEYEFGLDKLSKCPTTTWYGIHQMLYSLEPWGVIKESKKSARKSIKESENFVNYIAVYDEDGDCCGYVQNESPRLTQDLEKALHFKDENEANTFRAKLIKRGSFNGDELYIEGMYLNESKKSVRKSIKESLNFKKDYAVMLISRPDWLKPFYWDFDEFRDDLLTASEEEEFTYYITEASTTDYRINIEFNDGFKMRYNITFKIIPKTDKATAKELNDYLN